MRFEIEMGRGVVNGADDEVRLKQIISFVYPGPKNDNNSL